MGYDALKVIAKKPVEPLKVTVPGCCAGIHDPGDIIRHLGFVGTGIGKGQPLYLPQGPPHTDCFAHPCGPR